MKRRFLLPLAALLFFSPLALAQQENDTIPGLPEFAPLCDSIKSYLQPRAWMDKPIFVDKATVLSRTQTLQLVFCRELSTYPFRSGDVKHIYAIVRENMPEAWRSYSHQFEIISNKQNINEIHTDYFDGNKEPVREHLRLSGKGDKPQPPLVSPVNPAFKVTRGLQGRHIALWQSHGYYYESSLDRWEFQRGRIFGTVEDLYTQSYVLPFLVPMLENAGAVVLLPRERDCNTVEIIVDNDQPSTGYKESGKWRKAPRSGFADAKAAYSQGENPFRMGTARIISGSKNSTAAASWTPSFPVARDYAVYVSYQSLDSSATDALYEVRHKGGVSRFSVNQKMGGGTWIYLGTFPFDQGAVKGQGVYLSGKSNRAKAVVTADAVKFGGGTGNILRGGEKPAEGTVSGYPRFTEAARYWLQWAGFADSVYAPSKALSDYRDDFQCRGHWVNALKKDYNVPLDLSFAFHTDAGVRYGDSIVGTLAIYTRRAHGKEKFPDGEARSVNRDLADLVQTQVVDDIRALYDSTWTRRGLWDRSYSECSVPEVPSMILELLSHQNFADMRYGLDPAFRFDVSRAVYKGILKYLCWLNDKPYTVQPLPVASLAVEVQHNGAQATAALSWTPSEDPLEPTASPTSYRVRMRVDDGAFDDGFIAGSPSARIPMEPGHLYSFQVTAINAGGESFPSEILSAGISEAGVSRGRTALVVNNFDRVAPPASFASNDSSFAGFMPSLEAGVPYRSDISYTGAQYEFRRFIPWLDDDNPGFGASGSEYETRVIAGNTFDFVSVHGAALLKAGYDVASASRKALLEGRVTLRSYPVVDLLCGKQLTTRSGSAVWRHQVFPARLREQLKSYTAGGGNLLVSGAYIASDAWDDLYSTTPDSLWNATELKPTREFMREVLKYKWMTTRGTTSGRVHAVRNAGGFPDDFACRFPNQPNADIYSVEAADGLIPACPQAMTILRYNDNNISAATFYKGSYRVIAVGFPLETVIGDRQRDRLFAELLKLFEE